MKIRNGFVSNSSSTSFCIYGVRVELSDLDELLEIISSEEVDDEDIDHDGQDLYTKLEEFTKDTILSYMIDGESDGIYLGRSYETLKNDETGKQFRYSVEIALKELKIDEKPEHIEETIYG